MCAPFRVCSQDCCSDKSPITVRDKVNNSTSSQKCCIFQGSFSRAVRSEWLCVLSVSSLFFSLVDIVAEVLYSVSQYGVWVCALRLRTAGGVDFCVILPPPPLPHLVLSTLPLSLSLFPSVSPSPTHLMLPTSLPPSFSPVSSANTVPCRVGRVMKKWLVCALRRTSYFIISGAFLPFTVRSLSPPLFLSLSLLFLSLFRLLPSFCSSHTQGGDLSSAREKKRKKLCCYFYSQGLPTARPSIDGAFFHSLLAGF